MRRITARHVCEIEEVTRGRHLSAIGASAEGELFLLSATNSVGYEVETSVPVGYRIHACTQSLSKTVLEFESLEFFSHIQRLASNEWLLVRARCSPGERNASVFDSKGKLVRSFHVGDGIEWVQTTADGDIWVGYFDEGVYSGTKPADAGLVCFDREGAVLFEYLRDIVPLGLPMIDDCYALNVASSSDVWLCYYAGFPLVHLQKKALKEYWAHPPIPAPKAFAFHGGRILGVAAYDSPTHFFLHLVGGDVSERAEIVTAEGDDLAKAESFAHGSWLFLIETKEIRGKPYPQAARVATVDLCELGD